VNTLALDDWEITCTSTHAGALADRLNALLRGRVYPAVPFARAVADAGLDLVEDLRAGLVHGDLDELEVIYRTTLPAVADDMTVTLSFASIAAIATVACNGHEVAWSQNQYRPATVDLSGALSNGGELVVTCHALTPWLDAERRPRPRWKTKLVADQRLRHVRLGLLGRIPSWTPPVPVIGLAGPVTLHTTSAAHQIIDPMILTALGDDLRTGSIDVRFTVARSNEVAAITAITAITARCHTASAPLAPQTDGTWHAAFTVHDVDAWWPHTHGPSAVYPVEVVISTADGKQTSEQIARTGFRQLRLDRGPDDDGFALVLNGERIFWRGSAWMPLDIRQPRCDPGLLRAELTRCRDAGMNMIRLTGVTGWEQPEFTALCDELGIAVWQDLPFATLDQPTDDAFLDNVGAEIRHHVRRLAASPSVMVLCGGSERQQQAAMLGLDRETIEDAAAARLLREIAFEQGSTAIIVACSPSGGHLPFAVDTGVSHYYGVGAYLRPLDDARHANVRFTTECLAFSNVPEPTTVHRLLGDGESAPTHPRWKQRVARDRGVGWDFEDVRDHYFRVVTGEDPTSMRWRDVDRYLELSRVVSSIVMAHTMQEWRRPTSTCDGAITWFLRDLWRGAGWGLIDSDGITKAAWSTLADTWASVSIGLIDEGVNGVDVWVHNDRGTPLSAVVELTRVRRARVVGKPHRREVQVGARSSLHLRADEVAGRFTDPSDAFLFGSSAHDAICARLVDTHDDTISRYVLDTSGGRSLDRHDIELAGAVTWIDEHTIAVDVTASGMARFVRVDTEEVTVDRHHVDLVPGETRRLLLRPSARRQAPAALHLAAVNAQNTCRVPVPAKPDGSRAWP
jgi:beta-mannosidase